MERKYEAHIGALAAFVIGLVATVITAGIGVAVSVRLSYNQTNVEVDCAFNSNNNSKEITVNSDEGDLYYALENCTSKRTSYKVNYKASSSASYVTMYNGYINSNMMVGYNYAGYADGWSKRYFKVSQESNLSSTTTHANFYLEVR